MDRQFNYRKMQQQSGGSRKKPVASPDPRNHRNSTKNIEMKTFNKTTENQRESRLRWVDENEDAELEKGSISSEEEVAFDTNTDPRMRARNVQDIWNRGEVEGGLKALPGSDELSTFLELGNEAGLVNHTYGQTTGLLLAAWRGNARMLATLFEFGASPCVADTEGRQLQEYQKQHKLAKAGSVTGISKLAKAGSVTGISQSVSRRTYEQCCYLLVAPNGHMAPTCIDRPETLNYVYTSNARSRLQTRPLSSTS